MKEQDQIVVSAKHLVHKLRESKPATHKVDWHASTLGERVADYFTDLIGSWRFIIVQSTLLIIWIMLNIYAWISSWDPYPFVLLNLVLSFQAAFTAPIIMMSQNRQSQIDRKKIDNDYNINVKAELEIELLHEKMDLLREKEIKQLTDIVKLLAQKVNEQSSKN